MRKVMLIALVFFLNTTESPALTTRFFLPSIRGLSSLIPFQNAFKFNPRSTSATPNIAYLMETRPTGIAGGSCVSGEWRTRALNTLQDADNIVSSFMENKFTLQAGSYNFAAVAIAVGVREHQIRLVNTATKEPVLIGSSEFASNREGPHTSRSGVYGLLSLTEPTSFELQQQCSVSEPDIGFGIPTHFEADEVYTQARIIQLASNNPAIFYLYDKKPQGIPGGDCIAGTWNTRTFTSLVDPSKISSLIHEQQFTLKPGTYNVSAIAPAVGVDHHQTVLYNVTTEMPVLIGTSEYASSNIQHSTQSTFYGIVTVNTPSVFELRHRCSKSVLETGFGVPASFGSEVYTQVRVYQLSAQPTVEPSIH